MYKIESVGVIAAIGQLEKWTTANGQTGCAKAIEVQELDGHRKDSLIITYRFGAVVELDGLKIGDVIRFECFVKTRHFTYKDGSPADKTEAFGLHADPLAPVSDAAQPDPLPPCDEDVPF